MTSVLVSRRLARFVAPALVVALAGAATSAVRAQESMTAAEQLVTADPQNGQDIEAVLSAVGLGAAWRSATGLHDATRAMTVELDDDGAETIGRLLATAALLESTIAQQERVGPRLRDAAAALRRAEADERDRRIVRNRADAHLRGVTALLQAVAIDLFAGSGTNDDALLGADGQALLHAQRTIELQGHTVEEMADRRRAGEYALGLAERLLTDAVDELATATATHDRLSAESLQVARSRAELEAELRELLPEAATVFVAAEVPRQPNLTLRAVDAYLRAELTLTDELPRCRVTWRTIAAIGAVESAHGTIGGRTVQADGTSSTPIVGLVLDGRNVDNYGDTVAAIADTDRGRWDGDAVHDRAVGPLQFIPETWSRWARDGDDDGEFDPHDLDDAAVATGSYLCNYGSHANWEVWKSAVFGYNHSPEYVASVKAALDRLQRVNVPTPDDLTLRPTRPWGTYVPMPIPEPETAETPTDPAAPVEPAG